jgi:starch-binding outer membrane protein, SusD/RagB family
MQQKYRFINRFIKSPSLIYCILILSILLQLSCKKLVEVAAPIDNVTTSSAFTGDNSAISGVNGIYSQMIGNGISLSFGNSAVTVLGGLSADELLQFGADPNLQEFQQNSLLKNNSFLLSSLWQPAYSLLYQTNACLEGLESGNVSVATKNQLIGECKFLRAYILFYLINLYGDVPMPISSDWRVNGMMSRLPQAQVYKQIISDLVDAQNLLVSAYPVSAPVRANKWAAVSLLARVYLYQKNWTAADSAASSVINSGNYNLVGLDSVFLANSMEAILQMEPTNVNYPFNVTLEGWIFNPGNSPSPNYFLTAQLLNSFEVGDRRLIAWIDSINYQGQTYYYPHKYKDWSVSPGGTITENYMTLRLAEQYLIRAEARAEENMLPGSISDLNIIRNRAGLSPDSPNDQSSLLTAIQHERQVELFAEWGHRWLDLKRTGNINTVLAPLKTGWLPTDQLYPIPATEITLDPNLKQNPGYN